MALKLGLCDNGYCHAVDTCGLGEMGHGRPYSILQILMVIKLAGHRYPPVY